MKTMKYKVEPSYKKKLILDNQKICCNMHL